MGRYRARGASLRLQAGISAALPERQARVSAPDSRVRD
jgi:hypothetical protein